MKLELRDAEGLTGVFIEVPLEQLRAELGSGSSSAAADPDAGAQLKETQDKVAELEEKLATAESRTMDDYGRLEKANFVIAFATALSPEDKAIFAQGTGISQVREPESEKKEAGDEPDAETAEVAEEEPGTIVGKTDKPGYKYLERLGLSVKE